MICVISDRLLCLLRTADRGSGCVVLVVLHAMGRGPQWSEAVHYRGVKVCGRWSQKNVQVRPGLNYQTSNHQDANMVHHTVEHANCWRRRHDTTLAPSRGNVDFAMLTMERNTRSPSMEMFCLCRSLTRSSDVLVHVPSQKNAKPNRPARLCAESNTGI